MKNFYQKTMLASGAAVSTLQLAVGSVYAGGRVPLAGSGTIDPGKGFARDIGSLINGILSFVMVIAALLVFMYLIWGGIEWITSGGDKGKTESARNKITAAVIGLVVLAASYAILLVALTFLGFSGLQDALNIRPIN